MSSSLTMDFVHSGNCANDQRQRQRQSNNSVDGMLAMANAHQNDVTLQRAATTTTTTTTEKSHIFGQKDRSIHIEMDEKLKQKKKIFA